MLNQISIMGRLTRDPELKTTPAGKSVCTITLAVERDFADPNGVRDVGRVLPREFLYFASRGDGRNGRSQPSNVGRICMPDLR